MFGGRSGGAEIVRRLSAGGPGLPRGGESTSWSASGGSTSWMGTSRREERLCWGCTVDIFFGLVEYSC
jgi:hypothetical protein